jgi:hypothetical protein
MYGIDVTADNFEANAAEQLQRFRETTPPKLFAELERHANGVLDFLAQYLAIDDPETWEAVRNIGPILVAAVTREARDAIEHGLGATPEVIRYHEIATSIAHSVLLLALLDTQRVRAARP